MKAISLENTLPPQVDPVKTEAQKMATDLLTLQNLWADLKNDPTLADDSMFWSQITTAVDAIGTEYNYLITMGIIPLDDLSKMFGPFNSDVLGLKISPSSQNTFLYICQEAEEGQPADLHQFLDNLVQQSGVFDIISKDTETAQEAFQKYADSH